MSDSSKILDSSISNAQNLNAWIWGFTPQAEIWNGRAAMLGFLVAFIIELVFS
jgi:Chlorophyll A-B binding protein